MNIVITGASKGLGFAVAEKFAADGNQHSFYLCARNKQNLEKAANSLQSRFHHIQVSTYACDVSNKHEVLSFAAWILQQTQSIHILVNNAGLYLPGRFLDEADKTLEASIQTNLYSAYYLTQALLPIITKIGKGHIFNVCSVASLHALPNSFSYSVSKFALMGFSKNLREDLKGSNIKVTTVYPGAFINDSRDESEAELQKIMQASDIANMMYAASQLSPQACVEEIVLRPQAG